MIVADTETIMLAWFSLLQGNLGSTFKDYRRRFAFFKDITNKPALLVRKIGDRDEYSGEDLPLTTIIGEMWVVANAAPDGVPESGLNALVTAVRAAAGQQVNFTTNSDGSAFVTDQNGNLVTISDEPDFDERQTIGGLVYRARIEGQSIYDSGDFDGVAKAKIPFTILVPSDE